jgi:ACS family tartrate transporter-like MFS transporter
MSTARRRKLWPISAGGWHERKIVLHAQIMLRTDSLTADRLLGEAVVSRVTWRLVPFLFVLYIVAYLDRINVGFAALQMQQQLGFNDAVYGLGAGMFFAGYFVFQVPSNLILQRVGARRWISLLMIVWGVISSSMIFVTTARSFYVLRFLLGLAEAGFFPGVILYLRNWFPPAARARTVARFMTAAALSGVVGGPVSGALLGVQLGNLAGWQWLFLMEGLPAILLGSVVWLFLTDRPEEAPWLAEEQRTWLTDALEAEHDSHPSPDRQSVFAAFTSWKIWVLIVVYLGLTACSYGISMWLPNLIRSLSGLNDFLIGVVSTIPYVAAAITMVVVGLHSDRTGERRWHVAVPAFLGGLGLLVAAYSNSVVPAIVAITVGVLGVFAMLGPFWAIPTSLLNRTAAAAGIALINAVGNLGGFFGPYIIGLVRRATGEFRGGLLLLGGSLLLGAFLVLVVRVPSSRR